MGGSPLSSLSRHELEFLHKSIKLGHLSAPISKMSLQALGRGKLFARLGPLAGAPRAAALALLEMALARPNAQDGPASATLVWTGPAVPLSAARPTRQMILELLGKAESSVLIAGYELDHGSVLLEPLFAAMRDRGVNARLFVDIRPAPSPKTPPDAYLALATHKLLARNWPFGAPLPSLFHYAPTAEHGSRKSLHAKCVVVDRRHVLIGSANFTRRGVERNLEIGVALDAPELAETLVQQFDRLIELGELSPLPVAAGPVLPEEQVDAADDSAVDPDALASELLVSPEAVPLFAELIRAGLPVPGVGEDVEDNGAIIGSAELTWERARVAVLLPEQEGCREKLERAGWSCFGIAVSSDELANLRELVGRET